MKKIILISAIFVAIFSFSTVLAVSKTKITNCAKNITCFINASKKCQPAKMTFTSKMDFGGLIISSNLYQEIKGKQANRCSYYLKYTKASVNYSTKYKNQLKKQGKTTKQITQDLKDLNKQQQIVVGKEGACSFAVTDLTKMLTNWKKGFYDSTDLDKGNCQGSYFETGLTQTCSETKGIEGLTFTENSQKISLINLDASSTLTVAVDGVTSTINYLENKEVNGLKIKNLGKEGEMIKVSLNCNE